MYVVGTHIFGLNSFQFTKLTNYPNKSNEVNQILFAIAIFPKINFRLSILVFSFVLKTIIAISIILGRDLHQVRSRFASDHAAKSIRL